MKIPSLTWVVLLLNLFCNSASGNSQMEIIADANGCKVYNPAPQENETISWSGDCLDGFAQGEGVLEWYINGQLMERYDGQMEEGWAEGNGILTSEQGMRYEGGWKKSVQDGYGTAASTDGSKYEGEWLDGKPHGRGTYTTPGGDVLSGQWENGELIQGSEAQRI